MKKETPESKPYAIPFNDLIVLIHRKSAGQEDSIIAFLNNETTDLAEVRTLNTILKNREGLYRPLLKALYIHPALNFLTTGEQAMFYYGRTQTMLIKSAIRGLYHSIKSSPDGNLPDEVKRYIKYLYKSCKVPMEQAVFEEKLLPVFSATKEQDEFDNLIRPLIFIVGDEISKGKHDAFATVANQLKLGIPIRELAIYLLGIWSQTKDPQPQLDKEWSQQAVKALEIMLKRIKAQDPPVPVIRKMLAKKVREALRPLFKDTA